MKAALASVTMPAEDVNGVLLVASAAAVRVPRFVDAFRVDEDERLLVGLVPS
jgi:hypothetical protein